MQVFNSFEELKKQKFKDTALVIGNFDGVHLGHHKLFVKTQEMAPQATKVVITFSPHPAKFFSHKPYPLLSSREEQVEIFKRLGIDIVFFMPFDQKMAELEPEEFIEKVVVPFFDPACIVVGYDFSFGKERKGNFKFLENYFAATKTRVYQIPALSLGGDIISSTRIRQLLQAGDVRQARLLLGRPYQIHGVVVIGKKIGRTIGVPTANLLSQQEIVPNSGVYVGTTTIGTETYKVVGNIGFNPTVDHHKTLKIEFHILDFVGDLYGQHLRFDLYDKLRDEIRFSSLEKLKEQIQNDIRVARDMTLV